MVFTNYVNKVKEQLESWGCQIRIGCEVYSVSSADGGFTVVSKDGSQEMYSGCIMAVHAPDALKMLGSQATFDEKRVLGAFQYANIDIFLHRDKKFMPQDRAVWSACNFVGNTDGKAYMTYWLNALQNIGETSHGFHEDGLKSSLIAAHGLLGKSRAISTNPRRCMVPSLMEKAARHFVVRFLGHYINTGHLILLEEEGTTLNFKGTRKSSSLKTILRVHNLRSIETNYDSDCKWRFGSFGLKVQSKKGNDFFAMFLDESMTSACAVFKSEDEDLKVAQMRKNSLLIEKARINEKHEVLELGCGWGTLAIETIKRTGCKYTSINIVEEQLKYEEMKAKEAGLQDHIKFLFCDYRQLPKTHKYDRIIACLITFNNQHEYFQCSFYNGMIEAIDHEHLEEFFGFCKSILCILIPGQHYNEHRKSLDFLKEYIMPEESFTSLSRVKTAMASASRLCNVICVIYSYWQKKSWTNIDSQKPKNSSRCSWPIASIIPL
ncbi:hypothetical protein ACOSQ3_014147 [Xanthoceras sorbifolium]